MRLRSLLGVAAASLMVVAAATAAAGPAYAQGEPAAADIEPFDTPIVGHLTQGGEPVPDVFVELYDVDHVRYDSTVTDATGAFSFNPQYATDYKIVFWVAIGQVWFENKASFEVADVITAVYGQEVVADMDLPAAGSLSVTATDSVTAQPISEFCAEAFGAASASGCTTDGTALLTGLWPGDYRVDAYTQDGLHDTGYAQATVLSGQTTVVAIQLTPVAAISAVVRDASTKEVLRDVCLGVRADGPGGLAPITGPCTDQDGRILRAGLPGGTYRLFVQAFDDVHGSQWVGPDGGAGSRFDAQAVTLATGQLTTVPDIYLDRAGTVSGSVTDSAGRPVENVCVYPYAIGAGSGPESGPNCTDASGHYTVTNLGPYKWPLEFVDYYGGHAWQWSGGAADQLDASTVNVRVGKMSTVNAQLAAPAHVAGTVHGDRADQTSIFAYNALTGDEACAYAVTDQDGVYRLDGLAGQRVKLAFRQYAPSATLWYRSAPDFASATAVRVLPGRTVTGIDVTFPS
jgi:hypothetical protein